MYFVVFREVGISLWDEVVELGCLRVRLEGWTEKVCFILKMVVVEWCKNGVVLCGRALETLDQCVLLSTKIWRGIEYIRGIRF